ncbi:hypothetical protein BDZ97DRAFT_1663886, partial [Flammula alnicola]
ACGGMFDLFVGYDERLLAESSRDLTTFQTPFGAMRLVTLCGRPRLMVNLRIRPKLGCILVNKRMIFIFVRLVINLLSRLAPLVNL